MQYTIPRGKGKCKQNLIKPADYEVHHVREQAHLADGKSSPTFSFSNSPFVVMLDLRIPE
jgi:hypothetical protein